MYTGLLHLHSFLRYVVLILVLLSIFQAFAAGNKPYTPANKKVNLFALISAHTQLLIGLVLYFISPNVNFSDMSNPTTRYWTVEHITMMVLAIVLITIGYSKSKKAVEPKAKHRAIYIYYTLAIVIVLLAILTMKGRPMWNI
ncbi:cytochrome B [Pedobacter sp. SD-b]|uniref:Cytochrome B n=1 Tax=Pedobacter segetis TaxID=2793069 RepID=A0ABS1BG46_9SPHI|nr:cytochrome B [Pedobacter segetis]MBK0381371.1 cytochrome B [Pedobacter segetis]